MALPINRFASSKSFRMNARISNGISPALIPPLHPLPRPLRPRDALAPSSRDRERPDRGHPSSAGTRHSCRPGIAAGALIERFEEQLTATTASPATSGSDTQSSIGEECLDVRRTTPTADWSVREVIFQGELGQPLERVSAMRRVKPLQMRHATT